VDKRIDYFKRWAARKGWSPDFMIGSTPEEWKGGLKAVFELWSEGWKECESAQEKTLVWDH
jgi:hypothetical protein